MKTYSNEFIDFCGGGIGEIQCLLAIAEITESTRIGFAERNGLLEKMMTELEVAESCRAAGVLSFEGYTAEVCAIAAHSTLVLRILEMCDSRAAVRS